MNDQLKLNLTPEEKKLFGRLFKEAENDSGVITADVALTFFQRTRLSQDTLGLIWTVVDPENRGFLAQEDFAMAMRLVGHYQAQPGRDILQPDLALRPAPLPMFEGINMPPNKRFDDYKRFDEIPPPGPIRVPTLNPDRVAEYIKAFEKAGAEDGLLPGNVARDFFVQSGLPNSTLSAIWNLADTEQQGALTLTEFIVAMHLLFSVKSGAMSALPSTCPPALFEAAARLTAPDRRTGISAPSAIPRQFSGEPRTTSPITRQQYRPPQASTDWAIGPKDKALFDAMFDKVDEFHTGYITGDQAVAFFSDSGLPHDTLALIWELATVRRQNDMNRDEFAVAIYLMRGQRGKPRPDLPATLPPNLVPPSLRGYVANSGLPQPAAIPAPSTFTQPPPAKSAAEDLFGLDELSSPTTSTAVAPVQQQQTTGGSASRYSNDPFATRTSASPTSATFQPPRGYKSFIPTSSFGQSLQQQNTGGSGTSSTREIVQPPRAPVQQPSAIEDLLGDADPEVSKKLTDETAELANMSNQIGQLRTQMQEVQTKKSVVESEIKRASPQKRDLEARLAQFRQQYEQEIRTVKALEEEYQSLINDTQKVSREFAVLDGAYRELQAQHQQVAANLESERRANAELRQRMSEVNQEIARMRPELEKMRLDARHEKGMVSITKKQLEKSESERSSIKAEMENLRSPPVTSPPAPAAPSREASNVASPAASVGSQSANPFFRKSPQQSFDNATAPSAFSRSPPEDQNKFGNIWGTAFASSPPATAPPPTTFGGYGKQTESESSEQNIPTPSASPPISSYREPPRAPAPPELSESRQTPIDLPIRGTGVEPSASMRVETPSSRWEGTATPTAASTSSPGRPIETARQPEMTSTGAAMFERNKSTSPVASTKSDASRSKAAEQSDMFRTYQPAASGTIPGAFPGSTSSPLQSNLTGESSFTNASKETPRTEPFSAFSAGSQAPSRTGTSTSKGDFDAAFASIGGPAQQRQASGSAANGAVGSSKKAEHYFPPLEIIEHDSDDSEPGFEDDFTMPSPQGKKHKKSASGSSRPAVSQETERDTSKPRTAVAASPSELPPITAQQSPPTYEQTAAASTTMRTGGGRESNSFPPEFGGLLPQRETTIDAPQPAQSPSQGAALFVGGGGFFGDASKALQTPSSSTVPSGDYQSAVSHPSAAITDRSTGQTSQSQLGDPGKPTFGTFGGNDDFDTGFDELEEARPDEGKDDEEFYGTSNDHSFEEFNPSFDSPTASKSNTLASDFDSGLGNMKSSTMSSSTMSAPKSTTTSHNWDDLMKGIDNATSSKGSSDFTKLGPFPDLGTSSSSSKPFGESSVMSFPEAPEPPKLGRALSEGTEHDDPILKQLTGMGYERTRALDALEKYDYNLDKAVDYLASPR